jgi:hypothetical protein
MPASFGLRPRAPASCSTMHAYEDGTTVFRHASKPGARGHYVEAVQRAVSVRIFAGLCLIAIAQHHDGVRREQLTVLTGYKRSTRDAYVQRLGERGCVSRDGERIVATPAGIATLGADYQPLPTGSAPVCQNHRSPMDAQHDHGGALQPEHEEHGLVAHLAKLRRKIVPGSGRSG